MALEQYIVDWLNRFGGIGRKTALGDILNKSGFAVFDYKKHTWAGGAATADTVTMNRDLPGSFTVVAWPIASAAVTDVTGAKGTGDKEVDLTTVGNGADGEEFHVVVLQAL